MTATLPASPADEELTDAGLDQLEVAATSGGDVLIANASLRAITAELRRHRSSPSVEWKPIDTAPKDGKQVLLAHHKFHTITLGYWHAKWGKWATPSDCEAPDTYEFDFFTHWMPLPEPPK